MICPQKEVLVKYWMTQVLLKESNWMQMCVNEWSSHEGPASQKGLKGCLRIRPVYTLTLSAADNWRKGALPHERIRINTFNFSRCRIHWVTRSFSAPKIVWKGTGRFFPSYYQKEMTAGLESGLEGCSWKRKTQQECRWEVISLF